MTHNWTSYFVPEMWYFRLQARQSEAIFKKKLSTPLRLRYDDYIFLQTRLDVDAAFDSDLILMHLIPIWFWCIWFRFDFNAFDSDLILMHLIPIWF